MGERTAIEWTDATGTPIRARLANPAADMWRHYPRATPVGWHCEHISEGCRHCYAEGMNQRLGTGLDFKPGHRADIEIFLDEKMLLAPLRWKKPRMIFVCSMTDAFADFVKDEWLDRMFAVMALCSQHTFQVLTKRPERMREYVGVRHSRNEVELAAERIKPSKGLPVSPKWCFAWPLPNVWLGTSAEDQQRADERIPLLLQTPAAVRFVSLEPLLGPIDLGSLKYDGVEHIVDARTGEFGFRDGDYWESEGHGKALDWVIVGGESGPHARPMHPAWPRSLRDQCAAAGVAFFFKRWGEHTAETIPGTEVDLRRDLKANQSVGWGDGKTNHTRYTRVGKRAAGRLLDGLEHNAMPSLPTGAAT